MNTLHDQICEWENLFDAYQNASRGKRGHGEVALFEYKLEENLLGLQDELRHYRYQPGAYQSFYIHEPKRRLISAAPFRDRVVHHALCNIIVPYFDQRFIYDSYANRVGKGTHRALDRCQYYAKRYEFVLQCDVEQFFPAIDHKLLLDAILKLLPRRGYDVQWLIERILNSGQGVLTENYTMRYFPGDEDKLAAYHRPRGLPIGNLTSQWWANVYLHQLDCFIKHGLGCPAYVRYVDDFMLFSQNKMQLWHWREQIIQKLAELRLTLHDSQAMPKPISEGIAFLGFIVFATHRRLKPRKGIAFGRKLKNKLHITNSIAIEPMLQGWINHVRFGNTWGLRCAMLRRFKLFAHEQ